MSGRRIVLVQDRLRSGGTERQTVMLARLFAEKGRAVSVLTFRPGGVLAPTLRPVRHRHLQPFDTRLNWFAPGLARALRAEDPGIVLLMGRMANTLGGGLPAALPSARVVATLRTGKALPAGYRRALRAAAHVVANSEASAARLRGLPGLPAGRVSVIRNGLVFPPLAPSPELRLAVRAAHGAPPDAVVFLCVGMLRPEKNQRALIEAAARLPGAPGWRLWLAGEGGERARCEALAGRLGVAGRVRFLGFHQDPRPLYAAADVAVLASRAESLSNFLLEAQAHGLPAVAARATGVEETLRDGRSGVIVPPDDVAALADALLAYLRDSALRLAAGRAAIEHARDAFDPGARADSYLALFERLLAS